MPDSHHPLDENTTTGKRFFLFKGCLTGILVCTPFWILLVYLLVKWLG
ncbi:hypothetical protein ACP26L_22355 [Paenibacillus sp. S-38]